MKDISYAADFLIFIWSKSNKKLKQAKLTISILFFVTYNGRKLPLKLRLLIILEYQTDIIIFVSNQCCILNPFKLTPKNYLQGYVNGKLPCPLNTFLKVDKHEPKPAYKLWVCHYSLLLRAILFTFFKKVVPLIVSAVTFHEA